VEGKLESIEVMLTTPNPKLSFIDFDEFVEFILCMKKGVITQVKRGM
jgi:hypothetical protein